MTEDELFEIWEKYAAGDGKAKTDLITFYQSWILHRIQKYTDGAGFSPYGLIRLMVKYASGKEFNKQTYRAFLNSLHWYARQMVSQLISDSSKEPYISVYKIDEIEKAQRLLQQELNRMPLAEEIVERAGSDVAVSDVREAQKYISQK